MSLTRNVKGQIWVETVIYTLIGIALIGLVLAILTPKIKEFRDRSVIEQTIDSLNLFDSKITEILDASGNKRKIMFGLDKGFIYVDSKNDAIKYVLEESEVRYSEPGVSIKIGRIGVSTEELTKKYKITLSLDYDYNLTYNGVDGLEAEQFSPVSIPYNFFIENRGTVNGTPWIDVTVG